MTSHRPMSHILAGTALSGLLAFSVTLPATAADWPGKAKWDKVVAAAEKEGKLVVLDKAALKDGKTKDLSGRLEKLGLTSVLVIDGPEPDANFARAIANIPNADLLPQQGANVYDIMRRDTLVLTKDAVQHLEARLK